MSKDIRYASVKEALQAGDIASIKAVFNIVPLSVVGRDIHVSDKRLRKFIEDPASFRLYLLERMAKIIEVDAKVLFTLILGEIRPK